MCTTKVYTERHPDGRREKSYRYEMCTEARLGLPCVETSSSSSSRTRSSQPIYSSYAGGHLPPTPSYTPVSSTPVYRSGDESDRSYHSSSSTGRRRTSRVYNTDSHYLEVNPHSYRPRESIRRAAERVVIVDSPPTPRTPPQSHGFARSAPSSPNFGMAVPHIVETSPRARESSRRYPVIVDERPRPRVQIVEPSPDRGNKTHSRKTSAESQTRSIPIPKQTTSERQRAEIARQNAEINKRPSVPVARPLKRSTTTYTAADFGLSDDFARLDLDRDARREARKREKAAKAEQEALDQRLRERLMPKRRATVGPGTRRHPVLYDDGVYRWE